MKTALTHPTLNSIKSGDALLQQLESFSYDERQRELVAVGKYAATSGDGSHLLTVLCQMAASKDHYERLSCISGLKGYLRFISNAANPKVPAEVLQAVSALVMDGSPLIYKRASTVASKFLKVSDALRLISSLPILQVKEFCKAMHREKKTTLLDECFKQPAISNNAQRRSVVGGFISETMALSLSSEVFLGLSSQAQGRLFLHFPASMAQKLNALIEETQKELEGDDSPLPVAFISVIREALRVLIKTKESRLGFELAKKTIHRLNLQKDDMLKAFCPYLAHFTAEGCDYINEHPGRLVASTAHWRRYNFTSRTLDKIFKLPEDVLFQLVLNKFLSLADYKKFPPTLREKILKERRELLTDGAGHVGVDYVLNLPSSTTRQTEAKRIFEDHKVDLSTRLRVLQVFPMKRIQELAKEYIDDPEVKSRIMCLEAIVKSMKYYRQDLKNVLEYCLKRKNEQDPYRVSMFSGLKQLPIFYWKSDHLTLIEPLVKSLLAAKDISVGSADNAVGMLVRIAWQFPDFAVSKLLPIFTWNPCTIPRYSRLPLPSAKALVTAIAPLQVEWIEQQNIQAITSSFNILDKHTAEKLMPQMEPLMKKCMKNRKPEIAKEGMRQYTKWLRGKAVDMLPELLIEEPDWILCDAAREILSNDIQGPLLTRFVKPVKNLSGKLVPKEEEDEEVRYIIFSTRTSRFCRWTRTQQRHHILSIIANITDPKKQRNHWEAQNTFRMMHLLPAVTLDDGLRPMVSASFQPAYIQSQAVGVLGGLNDDESLKELTIAITEDGPASRTREAIRPLTTRLRKLPYEHASAMLDTILACKVITAQKEAVRLLGSYGSDAAFQRLKRFEAEKGEGLHKDVRVALMTAYWSFLWKPEVWSMYETIANGPRAAAAMATMNIPDELLTSAWQHERFNGLVLTLLRHSDPAVVQSALSRLQRPQKVEDPRWYPIIYKLMQKGEDDPTSGSACATIIGLRVKVEDLTQSVSTFESDPAVSQFIDHLPEDYSVSAPTPRCAQIAYSLARKLIAAGRQPKLACRCMLLCYPSVWIELLELMKKTGLLHFGAQAHVLKAIKENYFGCSEPFASAMAEQEQKYFRTHQDPFFRHVGLNILASPMHSSEWTAESRAALIIYQADEDRWVRDDAKLVLPPKEEEKNKENEAEEEG